jgi:hypothetical protein
MRDFMGFLRESKGGKAQAVGGEQTALRECGVESALPLHSKRHYIGWTRPLQYDFIQKVLFILTKRPRVV